MIYVTAYRVILPNGWTEFPTLEAAESYRAEHNITEPVEVIEKTFEDHTGEGL